MAAADTEPWIAQRIQDIRGAVAKNKLCSKEGRIIAELEETLESTQKRRKFSAGIKTLELIAQISGILPVKGNWRKRPQHSGYVDQRYSPLTDEALRAILQEAKA